MSKSHSEEIIALLSAICCLICATNGWVFMAWCFGVKAAMDCGCSIYEGRKEIKKGKQDG